MNRHSLSLVLCGALTLAGLAGAEELEAKPFELADEVVCKVNTETISKHQVEENMDEIVGKLTALRRQLEANGQWNAQAQKEYEQQYNGAFREALRRVVRQRLMVQHAKAEPNAKVDEQAYQKRLKEMLDKLRGQGLLGAKGLTPVEVERRLREGMLVDNWWGGRFGTVLEQPSKREVQKYYQENINRFFRPAGVMVRIVRIDGITTHKLTGQKAVRRDAREVAEKLREDLHSFAGNFAEVAKASSDDEETKVRGGLIMVSKNDPYFNPEGYSAQLATVLRGMEPGQISTVFELGKSSYAFVRLEGRREAGPAPLEGALWDETFRTLLRQKARKQENDWFRKALSKSLVVKVVNAVPEVIPVDFFFEEETELLKAQAPGPAEPGKAEAEPKKKD